jgi:hypothetical protein
MITIKMSTTSSPITISARQQTTLPTECNETLRTQSTNARTSYLKKKKKLWNFLSLNPTAPNIRGVLKKTLYISVFNNKIDVLD